MRLLCQDQCEIPHERSSGYGDVDNTSRNIQWGGQSFGARSIRLPLASKDATHAENKFVDTVTVLNWCNSKSIRYEIKCVLYYPSYHFDMICDHLIVWDKDSNIFNIYIDKYFSIKVFTIYFVDFYEFLIMQVFHSSNIQSWLEQVCTKVCSMYILTLTTLQNILKG